jgi:hypothetical protein
VVVVVMVTFPAPTPMDREDWAVVAISPVVWVAVLIPVVVVPVGGIMPVIHLEMVGRESW